MKVNETVAWTEPPGSQFAKRQLGDDGGYLCYQTACPPGGDRAALQGAELGDI
jgi:hypothetical protein